MTAQLPVVYCMFIFHLHVYTHCTCVWLLYSPEMEYCNYHASAVYSQVLVAVSFSVSSAQCPLPVLKESRLHNNSHRVHQSSQLPLPQRRPVAFKKRGTHKHCHYNKVHLHVHVYPLLYVVMITYYVHVHIYRKHHLYTVFTVYPWWISPYMKSRASLFLALPWWCSVVCRHAYIHVHACILCALHCVTFIFII